MSSSPNPTPQDITPENDAPQAPAFYQYRIFNGSDVGLTVTFESTNPNSGFLEIQAGGNGILTDVKKDTQVTVSQDQETSNDSAITIIVESSVNKQFSFNFKNLGDPIESNNPQPIRNDP